MQTTVINQTVLTTLTSLIEACQSVGMGFRDAVEAVFSPKLKALFSDYALQWIRYVGELQLALQHYDAESRLEGLPSAASTALWFDLSAALTTGNEIAILAACLYSENVALETYNTALKQDLPPALYHLIDFQRTGMDDMRQQLSRLRDSLTSA